MGITRYSITHSIGVETITDYCGQAWGWLSNHPQPPLQLSILEGSTTWLGKFSLESWFTGPLFLTQGLTPSQGFGATTTRGANDDRLAETFPGRIQGTLDLFTRTRFNDASSLLEGIHNGVHVFLGGDMPFVYRSSFDPIFWLHHCNVDRLKTMYQATHPGVALTPRQRSPTFALGGNGPDDLSTRLFPFRHPDGREWTSNDVRNARSIHDYGYSYPEVPPNLAQPALRAFTTRRINELYRPSLQSSEFQSLKSRAEDSDPGKFASRRVK